MDHRWTPAALDSASIKRKAVQDLTVVQKAPCSHLETGRDTIRFLLGEENWSELLGRVPRFVGESLHIPLGVITTHIERTDKTVVWVDFGVHGAGPEEPGDAYGPDLA